MNNDHCSILMTVEVDVVIKKKAGLQRDCNVPSLHVLEIKSKEEGDMHALMTE